MQVRYGLSGRRAMMWCLTNDDFPGGNHLQDVDGSEILASALEAQSEACGERDDRSSFF